MNAEQKLLVENLEKVLLNNPHFTTNVLTKNLRAVLELITELDAINARAVVNDSTPHYIDKSVANDLNQRIKND